MNFRVYITLEVPILDTSFELLVPIDRRIHDVIDVLRENIKELKENYYQNKIPNIFNKSNGELYDMNLIIKDSDIKTGTRLILI
ncbi:MAG: hypothetical protein IKI04_02695 [Bacilli bacterium]|nr:hypothetical protein [Bacilli bacterium]